MATPPVKPLTAVDVSIVYPTPNSHVAGGGNFVTYGRVDPVSATMTAWIMDGATRYDGEATAPPVGTPPYQWAFAFEGIPTGHSVTLTVKAVSGSSESSKSIFITCDA